VHNFKKYKKTKILIYIILIILMFNLCFFKSIFLYLILSILFLIYVYYLIDLKKKINEDKVKTKNKNYFQNIIRKLITSNGYYNEVFFTIKNREYKIRTRKKNNPLGEKIFIEKITLIIEEMKKTLNLEKFNKKKEVSVNKQKNSITKILKRNNFQNKNIKLNNKKKISDKKTIKQRIVVDFIKLDKDDTKKNSLFKNLSSVNKQVSKVIKPSKMKKDNRNSSVNKSLNEEKNIRKSTDKYNLKKTNISPDEEKKDLPKDIQIILKVDKYREKNKIYILESSVKINEEIQEKKDTFTDKKGSEFYSNCDEKEYIYSLSDLKTQVGNVENKKVPDLKISSEKENQNKNLNSKNIEEQSVNNKGENHQNISYSIVSPTGEMLYKANVKLKNPVTVLDLLLNSGLDIKKCEGFIKGIAGINNQGMAGWVFEVNDVPVMVSASEFIVNADDHIKWKYVDFSKINVQQERNFGTKKVLKKKDYNKFKKKG